MGISKWVSPKRWGTKVRSIVHERRMLGLYATAKLCLCHVGTILWKDFGLKLRQRLVRLDLPFLQHPLYLRALSSDVYVARQVLVEQEHAVLSGLPDIQFIVDCGANIGCAAAYLLSRFPSAHLVAIEPDPDNFVLLARNLEPYGVRATAIRAAVWGSSGAALSVRRGTYRDGLDWSATVEPSAAAGDVEGLTLSEVMGKAGRTQIDLLKIDIEGSELALLAPGNYGWLDRTKHLCIELHGKECEDALDNAIAGYNCERTSSNELSVLSGISAKFGPMTCPA